MDDPHETGIRNPVPDKTQEVLVADDIEESFDVGLNHPLGALVGDDFRDPSLRIMSATARPESIRAVPKLRRPDRLQNPTHHVLNQPISKTGDSHSKLHLMTGRRRGGPRSPIPSIRCADVASQC